MLEMKEKDKEIFLLFMDMDGLKTANDTLGHEIGDWMIREMAEVIKSNLMDDQMAMRYGGDEFVVFGSYEDDIEIDYLLESIQASMERRNTTGKNPFQLSASIGVTKYHAVDVKELSEVIDIADTNMYEEKRKKREQKNLYKVREKL